MTNLQALLDKKDAIAVVGLGYVGLPLAVGLSRYFKVIGFDVNKTRVNELNAGQDHTGEVITDKLKKTSVEFTTNAALIKDAAVIIVAVPTPVNSHHHPNLSPVEAASRTVGQNLKRGTVVVYESTVYPGVTEDICVPILEKESGLVFGQDFHVGYSPERINPGDKVHTVESIIKVVAASCNETLELLAGLYGKLVHAGIHKASSIKVAEAAKVIENTQRDINIALMNELALIFHRMGIDTLEVLEAAGTKWNFIPFRPGLVGGHCIGVDPYYLTFKAQELGYQPEVILAGRRINDNMGRYVAGVCVKQMIHTNCRIKEARVGILGFTFKENVPDLRNTRVIDIVQELAEYGVSALIHDPLASPAEAKNEYGVTLCGLDEFRNLDAVILAVAHEYYKNIQPCDLVKFFRSPTDSLLMDLKDFWTQDAVHEQGIKLWRL